MLHRYFRNDVCVTKTTYLKVVNSMEFIILNWCFSIGTGVDNYYIILCYDKQKVCCQQVCQGKISLVFRQTIRAQAVSRTLRTS